MKTVKVMGYGLLVIGMLLVSMPAMAQQQEWKSTSTLQSASGSYTAPITAVGATSVPSEATTTTESYSPAKAPGPRKGFDVGAETGQSSESPVGDAVLPLMLLAGAYLCMRVIFRRKRAMNS